MKIFSIRFVIYLAALLIGIYLLGDWKQGWGIFCIVYAVNLLTNGSRMPDIAIFVPKRPDEPRDETK